MLPEKCTNCGSDDLVEDHTEGTLLCRDKKTADPNRVGGPVNPLLQNNLTTMIQRQKGANTQSYFRLTALQHRNNPGDQALMQAFNQIQDISNALSLGQMVKTKAQEIYKLGYDGKVVTGRGNKAVYGACVYLACKEEQVPRNPKEVLAALGGDVRQKQITKYVNGLKQQMKEKRRGVPARIAHPADFLHRFLAHLGATQAAKRAAIQFANAALPPDGYRPSGEVKPWDSRQPTTVAAAIIYCVCNLVKGMPEGSKPATFDAVAEVTGAAVGTIRDAFRQFGADLYDLIPENFATKDEIAQLLQTVLGAKILPHSNTTGKASTQNDSPAQSAPQPAAQPATATAAATAAAVNGA